MRYRTTLHHSDFSNGIFLEGRTYVSDEGLKDLIQKFENGKISLYENTGKYIENTLAKEQTVINFSKDEYYKTGEGCQTQYRTIKGENLEDYQNFYWLEIKEI